MTRNFPVVAAPTNIVSSLSLTVGESYTIEIVFGSSSNGRLWEGAAAPTDLSYFHTLTPGLTRSVTPKEGEGIWVWRTEFGTARLVVTDAP